MVACIGFTNAAQRRQMVSREAQDARLPFSPVRRDMARVERMSVSTDPRIRAVAAGHPKTKPETLSRLADDPEFVVRSWVARNPECPTEILVHMLDDKSTQIQAYVSMRLA